MVKKKKKRRRRKREKNNNKKCTSNPNREEGERKNLEINRKPKVKWQGLSLNI